MCMFKKKKAGTGAASIRKERRAIQNPLLIPSSKVPPKATIILQNRIQRLESKEQCVPTCSRSKLDLSLLYKKRAISKDCTKDLSTAERKRRLEDAQKAMGAMPNSVLLDRIQERQERREQIDISVKSTTSKRGDIQFVLPLTKKKVKAPEEGRKKNEEGQKKAVVKEVKKEESKDDDTMHPLIEYVKDSDLPKEEEFVEDQDTEDPNSENYMYNEKEIEYTCHDMIRELNKNNVGDATGEPSREQNVIQWNPYANIDELLLREGFDCATLRRNTFLSNSLSMPTPVEQVINRDRQYV